MEANRRELKVKNIEYLPDSIVCEIEPLGHGNFILNYFDIHKKDVSPEKFLLTQNETKIPFHTKRHLPEFYKEYLEKGEARVSLLNHKKRTFAVGDVIGEAIRL